MTPEELARARELATMTIDELIETDGCVEEMRDALSILLNRPATES